LHFTSAFTYSFSQLTFFAFFIVLQQMPQNACQQFVIHHSALPLICSALQQRDNETFFLALIAIKK